MIVDRVEWDQFLSQYPNAHFLQTGAWGELKSRFGWRAIRVIQKNQGAQILLRILPLGFTIAYLAKGPVGEGTDIYAEIDRVCKERRAIFLKIEPDEIEGKEPDFIRRFIGLEQSNPIQPRRTLVVPLEGTEEEILNRMKQKTRYNIRLAEKKDVIVKPCSDVRIFYEMAQVTAMRDAFGVHNMAYYQSFYDLFHPNGECELLTAYYNGQPLASLFVIVRGKRAYYLYGASSDLERNRMPAYLIQWEAMKWARERGCISYDLWGIPDLEEEDLERGFQKRQSHDGLWGVYRFKRGFGGEVQRSAGAWDRIYNKPLYKLYSLYMNRRGGQTD